jgi:hypothetical protein
VPGHPAVAGGSRCRQPFGATPPAQQNQFPGRCRPRNRPPRTPDHAVTHPAHHDDRGPVLLEIGPVLHADDAVANKMAALYGRALARDFLDIDAILASGRYTRERLLELASSTDV